MLHKMIPQDFATSMLARCAGLVLVLLGFGVSIAHLGKQLVDPVSGFLGMGLLGAGFALMLLNLINVFARDRDSMPAERLAVLEPRLIKLSQMEGLFWYMFIFGAVEGVVSLILLLR